MGRNRSRRIGARPAVSRKTQQQAKAGDAVQGSDEAASIVPPTPEQEARGKFVKRAHTTEMGHRVGFGYRRRALFETMAESGNSITRDELAALRFYRSAFDRCDRSPTRSCLAVGTGGGRRGSVETMVIPDAPAMIEARRKVRMCEAALGPTLATMRAVALDDRSFSDIAMERYGSRRQSWIIVNEPVLKNGKKVTVGGKPVTRTVAEEKIVPRSGRHREIIRQEFAAGLKLLADQVRFLVSTPGVEEVWIALGADGARIERGACAPNGLYRMWGGSGSVDGVLRDMRAEHGERLVFPTAPDAKAALDAAAGLRLNRLDEEELRP